MTMLRAQGKLKLRNRRGAVLVWFGMSVTVLLMLTAVSLDFAFWYVAQNQLQTAADAAALRGARTLQLSQSADPEPEVDAAVVAFSPANNAQGKAVTVTADQVRLAWWDPTPAGGRPGEPDFNLNGRRANAVVVTNAQTGVPLIGRIFDLQRPNLGKRAIAWVANLNGNRCIRPWGIPINGLVSLATDGQDDSFRPLTPAEIAKLEQMTPEQLTLVFVPPNKTWKNNYTPPEHDAEWSGIRFDREQTTTQNQGMDEFNRLSAGGCIEGQPFRVGDIARTDLPANSLPKFMADAVEGGYKKEHEASCHNLGSGGDATCYASAEARMAGEVGVKIPVVFSSFPDQSQGTEPVSAIMLGEFVLTCVYQKETDTCAAKPGATTGYMQGSFSGYVNASFFTRLSPNIELGNTPSTSQRLLLVR